jgi:hypothetical protein
MIKAYNITRTFRKPTNIRRPAQAVTAISSSNSGHTTPDSYVLHQQELTIFTISGGSTWDPVSPIIEIKLEKLDL